MFTTGPQHYTRNVGDAAKFTATPASIGKPGGTHEPGVVLKLGRAIKAVMPVPEALRLANEIADALAAHHTESTDRKNN